MLARKNLPWFSRSLVAAVFSAILLGWLPPVQASDQSPPKGALAVIEVSASKEVLQDQVRVVFSAQASGSTAADVNRTLSEALEKARANFNVPQGVELSTGDFSVYLDYGKDNQARGWAGRASLVVFSQKLESVSAVIEHLGKSLAVSSVQFSLSADARRTHENSLMQQLAQELGQRAGSAVEAFGFKGYQIVGLDFTGSADFSPRPVMQRMTASPMQGDTGPVMTLEPAMASVELSVRGQIHLH